MTVVNRAPEECSRGVETTNLRVVGKFRELVALYWPMVAASFSFVVEPQQRFLRMKQSSENLFV